MHVRSDTMDSGFVPSGTIAFAEPYAASVPLFPPLAGMPLPFAAGLPFDAQQGASFRTRAARSLDAVAPVQPAFGIAPDFGVPRAVSDSRLVGEATFDPSAFKGAAWLFPASAFSASAFSAPYPGPPQPDSPADSNAQGTPKISTPRSDHSGGSVAPILLGFASQAPDTPADQDDDMDALSSPESPAPPSSGPSARRPKRKASRRPARSPTPSSDPDSDSDAGPRRKRARKPAGGKPRGPASAEDQIAPKVLSTASHLLFSLPPASLSPQQRQQCVEHILSKRSRNTAAARRSRERRREHVGWLEGRVAELEGENEMLRGRVGELEALLMGGRS
ncbi:hypothetical protein DFJ74DRAFT_673885 [Hyaloraphidium curvatum]|nr:hypothetical protein DFJ74DRAFT_673885 [Hyaloraphidium curvatum]